MRQLIAALAAASLFMVGSPALAQGDDSQPAPSTDSDQTAPPPPQQQEKKPSAEAAQEQSPKEKEGEAKDSGQGVVGGYLLAEGGFSFVNMESFNSTAFALQNTKDQGPAFGFGGGVRFLIFTFGVRVRDNLLSQFNLWQLDAEFGLNFKGNPFGGYIAFRGGYDFVGSLSGSSVGNAVGGTSPSDVSVHGWNAGAAIGIDYYFSNLFSLGVEGNGDFLFLQRPQVALPPQFSMLPPAQQDQIKNSTYYKESGSSVGLGLGATLHLGIHF